MIPTQTSTRFLSIVQAFHATPDVVVALVPANSDRSRARVTRDEIASLFANDLYAPV